MSNSKKVDCWRVFRAGGSPVHKDAGRLLADFWGAGFFKRALRWKTKTRSGKGLGATSI
jgi:hypothetical protein